MLARCVRRETYADAEAPSRVDRQVFLAYVDEICAAENCQVGPVVDDQRDSEPRGHGSRLLEHE